MKESGTTFAPVGFYTVVAGMSQAALPHMTPEDTWWESWNFRFTGGEILQTPGETLSFAFGGTNTGISLLAPFIVGVTTPTVLALGGTHSWKLDFENSTATEITPFPGPPPTDPKNLHRWQAVPAAGKVYFTNKNAGLFKYDGTTVTAVIVTGPPYKGKYLETFYGHLVMANVKDGSADYPLRVVYSDKDDFSDFAPTVSNEADFFELDDNQNNALYGLGITGAKRLGDQFAIHTPGSIWVMRYVGFDAGVMEFGERINGLGCWLPYALLAFDRFHIFPAQDDFYVFDGATVQSIGGPIRDFFFKDLSQEPELRNKTWATIDPKTQELRWYYVSVASSNLPDKCLVFNWPMKAWYLETAHQRSTALHAGFNTIRTIDGLVFVSSTIDGLVAASATIDGLSAFTALNRSNFGKYTQDNLWHDESDLAIEGTEPQLTWPQGYLISRDIDLRQKEYEHEINSLLVDASIGDVFETTQSGPHGWDVYVSTRDFYFQPVTFVYFGRWLNNDFTKLVNIRLSGRIVRFKFVTKNLTNTQFIGYSPFYGRNPTEK